ncbi:MAG: competence protein ComEA [Candidatus Frackibacter sp. T328-2]|nr:MAG: competence protein ComEA [Candidatus Frackibacter sp. T328-2]
MFRFTKKEEMILLVIIVTLILGSGIIGVKYLKGEEKKEGFVVDEAKTQQSIAKVLAKKDNGKKELTSKNEKSEKILVQIGGAVEQPGVYKLKRGSRVYQLIEKAEGATDEADLDRINLVVELKDGEKVIIPTKARAGFNKGATLQSKSNFETSTKTNNKININTASKKELQKLYRIGPALAERIIKYRNQHGDFSQLKELKKVSGIGKKTFQRNKEQLTL